MGGVPGRREGDIAEREYRPSFFSFAAQCPQHGEGWFAGPRPSAPPIAEGDDLRIPTLSRARYGSFESRSGTQMKQKLRPDETLTRDGPAMI
jgi:hypothetical protein